jgi:hypothetical protein
MTAWNALIRDHHPGYISREQYEANQRVIAENAHVQRRTERKSARGGRALLTGLVRCGRCGENAGFLRRAVRPCSSLSLPRRGQSGRRLAVRGRAIAAQIVEAVSEHAIEPPHKPPIKR